MNCAFKSHFFNLSRSGSYIIYVRKSRHYILINCLWNTTSFIPHTASTYHSHISDVDLGWLSRSSVINHRMCLLAGAERQLVVVLLLPHAVTKPIANRGLPLLNTKYNLLPFSKLSLFLNNSLKFF
jgi:hypothetical protein